MPLLKTPSPVKEFDSFVDRDNDMEFVSTMPSGIIVYIVSRLGSNHTDQEMLIEKIRPWYPDRKIVFHPNYIETILPPMPKEADIGITSRCDSVRDIPTEPIVTEDPFKMLKEIWVKIKAAAAELYDPSRDRPKGRNGKPIKPWER